MYSYLQLQRITATTPSDADGCCADVWFLDDQLILKRIQNTDTPSLIFMQYCLDNMEDKHLPDILAIYSDELYTYQVIERLGQDESLREASKERDPNGVPLSGGIFRKHLSESFSNTLDKLHEFYNNTPELHTIGDWDLHWNNMMDRNGVAVISDPWCPKEGYYNKIIDTNLLNEDNEVATNYGQYQR